MGVTPYELALTCEGSTTVIHLVGELDLAASVELGPQLRRLACSSSDDVLIDLHQVSHIDSEGLKMLLIAIDHARSEGRSARVTNLSECARRVIAILGLGDVLGCPDDTQTPNQRRSLYRPQGSERIPRTSFQ